MSVIAQKWAYSQPIKNPVAKNILAFLSSHNFPGNKTFFGVQTISGATAYSRRAVIDGLKFLVDNKYLIKEIRVSESGGQQSNVYILNIPQEYVESFCSDYAKLCTPPVQEAHPPRAGAAPPPVQELHPNNNIINNNINKSSCSNEQKKHKSKSTTLESRVVDNTKKHDWYEKPKSPMADVSTQTTSHYPDRDFKRSDPQTAAHYLKNLKGIRLKRYAAENDEDVQNVESSKQAGSG